MPNGCCSRDLKMQYSADAERNHDCVGCRIDFADLCAAQPPAWGRQFDSGDYRIRGLGATGGQGRSCDLGRGSDDHRPLDVKGVTALTYAHKMRPDDRWLYLSKLRWVKCVSYANQAGPFVGSGFAYEDIGAQELEKYTTAT